MTPNEFTTLVEHGVFPFLKDPESWKIDRIFDDEYRPVFILTGEVDRPQKISVTPEFIQANYFDNNYMFADKLITLINGLK